jgi:hypothetical protein
MKLIFKSLVFSGFPPFKLHTNPKPIDNNTGNKPEILGPANISYLIINENLLLIYLWKCGGGCRKNVLTWFEMVTPEGVF